jgi:GPH family glycoside/pentoside/hexuronide:cation symporter
VKIALANRAFLFVVGIYLFAWLALQMTASVIPFYATFWMGLDSYFLAALLVQGTAILMMGVVNALSRRLGKQEVFYIGLGTWVIAQIALFFVQPGQAGFLYLLCVVISFGVATAYVVPWAMLPDVVELDELKTGQRREGIFYAFMTLLQKVGLAPRLFLVSLALEFSGSVSAAGQQPETALLAIRFFIGPVPMVLLLAAMALARFYPITRQVHEQILLQLSERRGLEDS